MSTPIIICDDSSMARKQLSRALPIDWDVSITYAENGHQAIEGLQKDLGDVLFLDLNMPVMDGYQVLQAMQISGLKQKVIVISGDIQEEAKKRVKELGALAFIQKPCKTDTLIELLKKFNIFHSKATDSEEPEPAAATPSLTPKSAPAKAPATSAPVKTQAESKGASNPMLQTGIREAVQEISNIAMGQAAALLASVLNVFVKMPIPNVNLLEIQELSMVLEEVEKKSGTLALCQSFMSGGVAGEALIIFHDTNYEDLARLIDFPNYSDKPNVKLEMLVDVSNILIGAFIQGFGTQLDMVFAQRHPIVLGDDLTPTSLLARSINSWKKVLTTEINYTIENEKICCDLLILFTEKSLETLQFKLNYLLDD
jgi:chemotaxis protein CheY-P-specific phosphatase CheC/FixJ family two-component response regulator